MEIKDISNMNYSELVGFVKERNRPSGGIRTIQNVAVNSFITKDKTMLEIGSNTGFTSVNMSLLIGCKCIGIDVNEYSIKEARKYAEEQNIQNKVSFLKANAESLPFEDESFDLVWCSNVTSFIEDKEKAIKEYLRVLKVGGTLVVVPIYYLKNPPKEIISKVSEAIGVKIQIWDKNFWTNLFEQVSERYKTKLELYYSKDFVYSNRTGFVKNYVDFVLNKFFLRKLSEEDKKIIKKRYEEFMGLFNENLKYAGFSILLYQKRKIKDELELFLTMEK